MSRSEPWLLWIKTRQSSLLLWGLLCLSLSEACSQSLHVVAPRTVDQERTVVGEQAGEQRGLYFKVIRRKKLKMCPAQLIPHAIACPGNTEKEVWPGQSRVHTLRCPSNQVLVTLRVSTASQDIKLWLHQFNPLTISQLSRLNHMTIAPLWTLHWGSKQGT